MSSAMNTILVIGGTSGIGEAFARRWHSQGKKIILTGRRQQRLDDLAKELSGTRTYTMDNTDLPALPGHVASMFEKFPDIDTVWINSGKGSMYDIKDPSGFSDADVIDEITTNVTGPMIIARHAIPRLIARKTPTNFLITSSGLAFVPNPIFPTYPATKAFIHHFMVTARGALKDTNVNVIEIAPPMVVTRFHDQYADKPPPATAMSLQDYVDETFKVLDGNEAADLKEVAAGTAQTRADYWRKGPGQWMIENNLSG